MTKILIVGEDPSVREFMTKELAGEGRLVVAIGNPALIGELLTTWNIIQYRKLPIAIHLLLILGSAILSNSFI